VAQDLGIVDMLAPDEITRKLEIRIASAVVRMMGGSYTLNDSPGEFKQLRNPVLDYLAPLELDNMLDSLSDIPDAQSWVSAVTGDTIIKAGDLFKSVFNHRLVRNQKSTTNVVLTALLAHEFLRIVAMHPNAQFRTQTVEPEDLVGITGTSGGSNEEKAVVKSLDRVRELAGKILIPV
jgi:hypothetical protein